MVTTMEIVDYEWSDGSIVNLHKNLAILAKIWIAGLGTISDARIQWRAYQIFDC